MRADRVAQAGKALLIGFGASVILAGCAVQSAQGDANAPAAVAAPVPVAGQVHPGVVRTGAQTGGMAAQYATPRQGSVAASGAGAWVPPAPPPAFVIKDMPPPAPPAPRPAAASQQPPAPAGGAADASQIARPEAATPEAAPAAPSPTTLSAATRQQGRELFTAYSCNACHALADADALGGIGPALDGNRNLTKAYVIDVVNDGRGAMPSFAGQMTDQEIATLADYIVGVHK
jgi:mono/diheme cytochrome c family protein